MPCLISSIFKFQVFVLHPRIFKSMSHIQVSLGFCPISHKFHVSDSKPSLSKSLSDIRLNPSFCCCLISKNSKSMCHIQVSTGFCIILYNFHVSVSKQIFQNLCHIFKYCYVFCLVSKNIQVYVSYPRIFRFLSHVL